MPRFGSDRSSSGGSCCIRRRTHRHRCRARRSTGPRCCPPRRPSGRRTATSPRPSSWSSSCRRCPSRRASAAARRRVAAPIRRPGRSRCESACRDGSRHAITGCVSGTPGAGQTMSAADDQLVERRRRRAWRSVRRPPLRLRLSWRRSARRRQPEREHHDRGVHVRRPRR